MKFNDGLTIAVVIAIMMGLYTLSNETPETKEERCNKPTYRQLSFCDIQLIDILATGLMAAGVINFGVSKNEKKH